MVPWVFSMSNEIEVYKARSDDAADIHRLIVALAVYEKEPQAVQCSMEDLRSQLCLSNPPFHCLLVRRQEQVVAFALYFFSYSTWRGRACLYLEDLFVLPEHRRQGIGIRLMQQLAGIALQNDCPRFEWSVLNWNQLAIDFYHKIGAVPMNEWTRYRLEKEQIIALQRRKI